MARNKVKVSSIVESQIPLFAREEYPFLLEFLESYYNYLESPGQPADILTNLESYVKLDFVSKYNKSTVLAEDIDVFSDVIEVESTLGFPFENGIIKINDEIIYYESKTDTTFENCSRGFSGITEYRDFNKSDSLTFDSSSVSEHSQGTVVNNLNSLLLEEFFKKLKVQFAPGFEDITLYDEIDENLFIKQVKDFYNAKGTDDAVIILFKALYGSTPKIIRPSEFLFTPSVADYRITLDLTVEPIIGDPKQIINRVLYQDSDGDIPSAYGTVVEVKEIIRDGNFYYTVSLDYGYNKDISTDGTVFGEFTVHAQTKTLERISIGSSVITVDSTVGFPDSGELIITYYSLDEGGDDEYAIVNYTSINANQFLGVTNINREIPDGWSIGVNSYVYSYDNEEEEVRMRVTGVLGDLIENSTTPYSKVGDPVQVWTLGKSSDLLQANTWIFNHAISNRCFSLTDDGNLNYTITTYNDCNVNSGDTILLNCMVKNFDGTLETISKEFEVFSGPTPKNSFRIKNDREIVDAYYVKRRITKVKNSQIIANVQNTYVDNKNSIYVTSNSLPNYFNEDLNVKYRDVVLQGTYNSQTITIKNHGLYTGDAVYYDPSYSNDNTLDLFGIYFVYRIDQDSFKLAKSRDRILSNSFETITGNSSYSKLVRLDFVVNNTQGQLLPQSLVKKITTDVLPRKYFYPIESNQTIGIFNNGVEALTYKSKDYCYYGEVEEIVVTGGGSSYDVVNPPTLDVVDSTGSGFSGEVVVEGALQYIDVIDGGFDYIETPSVVIRGGNPTSAASAAVEMTSKIHKVFFRTEPTYLNTSENTITFTSPHKFRDADRVYYNSEGNSIIGGLQNNTYYYVGVISNTKVSLHKNIDDALTLSNSVGITSTNLGDHSLESDSAKNVVSKIIVADGGTGYSNNKAIITSSGINTTSYVITSKNHKFKENDRIVYSYTESSIVGLDTNKVYIVSVLNDESFRLYEENTTEDGGPLKFKQQGKIVKISSTPSGYHTFAYEPITVEVVGKRGVSDKVENDCLTVLNPVFRGSVRKVEIKTGGSNYGSNEILNFQKQPRYYFRTGQNAICSPIVFGGKIKGVTVLSSGQYYNSIPNIYVFESNPSVKPVNAKLTPIIGDGKLKEVKVLYEGYNHSENVKIIVESPATGATLEFKIKSWNVNLVERLILENNISSDDSVLSKSIRSNFGLQYTHAYAPRKLRNMIYSQKLEEGIIKYQSDLENDLTTNLYHSPILGWAYDGNPIYGPYGYDTPSGGRIKQIRSGYKKVTSTQRPSFPLGFFVEDYVYDGSGDLDEHNGRFCITPEFPNGTYAYFLTLGEELQKEGSFSQGKLPEFPYIVGESHYSQPIVFNQDPKINQADFDFGAYKCRRNVKPYNLKEWFSGYEYLVQPNKIDAHYSVVKSISPAAISEIEILKGGSGYKPGDYINFDNVGTGGTNINARVALVGGKDILSIQSIETLIEDVKVYTSSLVSGLFAVCNDPHELTSNQFIKITGISTSQNIAIDSVEKISFPSLASSLDRNIADSNITGIVTYISLTPLSLQFPIISENDIIQINSEKFKILNVDSKSSRLRVLREYDSTTGTSHSAGNAVNLLSRKLFIKGYSLRDVNISKIDRELYFDPSESVAIGLTHGVGITTTLYFSNPGIGKTQLEVPTRTIYIEDHNLSTGDSLIYNSNDGTPLVVSFSGIGTTSLVNDSILYAVVLDQNTIGLSTVKLGISSTGEYIGIGTTQTSGFDLLYFADIPTGYYHSLKTEYNYISADVFQNTITVSTKENSNLRIGDTVEVNVTPKIQKTYKVTYNDDTRRVLIGELEVSNIDIEKNQIYITNHGLVDGDKILYQVPSSDPLGIIDGLQNNQIYYAVYINRNIIELSTSFSESSLVNGSRVNVNSVGGGYFYKVNPSISCNRNNVIKFELGDPSLSYVKGIDRVPAFDFKLYYDSDFREEYITNSEKSEFNVKKEGIIGVDFNANVTVTIDELTPIKLYYRLVPKKDIGLSEVKKQVTVDNIDVKNANKIEIQYLQLNNIHEVVSVGDTSFTFKLTSELPDTVYNTTNSILEYNTPSTNTTGPIKEVKLTNYGSGYVSLSGIGSIISVNGTGAKVKTKGSGIGAKRSYDKLDVGWDYPTDVTLYPTAKLPTVLELDQLFAFDSISLSSPGLNYRVFPGLVVKDSTTLKVLSDLILSYTKNGVEIVKNTSSLSNDNPIFIPINNSNGFSIKNLSFNFSSKNAVLTFKQSFSEASQFPFQVGDEVLIEGCSSKTLGSNNRTFNSSDFSYQLFTITQIDPNIGGSNGTITFNLTGIVNNDETLGEYDEVSATGLVVPKKFFPTFTSKIKKSSYIAEETIKGSLSGAVAQVKRWDSKNEMLFVFGPYNFKVGENVVGEKSGTTSIITNIIESDLFYEISSAAAVNKGWKNEKGFLNNNFEKIQDSLYWQKFSYSINSNVSENVWENSVDSLTHISGWKRFSDYSIESKDLSYSGISTSQDGGDFVSICYIDAEMDINCVYDFDLVLDETYLIGSKRVSNGLIFNSRDLQDYDKSIGNRVLVIDDISDDFNNTPRPDPFSVVETFKLNQVRSKKYLIYARDRRFTSERQVYFVTFIHNGSDIYINQYGRVETVGILGSFDADIFEDEGRLLFYPTKFRVNDYDLSFISYDIRDYISGIGTTSFGDIVDVRSNFTFRSSGISTTIASIPLEYRASKLLVQIEDTQNVFEYDEITVLHDGTNVEILDYGQITTDSIGAGSSLGIGTYYAYISGSNLNIDLIPDYPYDADINVLQVSIASSESGYITNGETTLDTTNVKSNYVGIGTSTSTSATKIAEFENGVFNYSAGYFIVSIEDITNQRYQISEIVVITDDTDAYYTEFGILYNDSEVGIITAGVNGSYTELYFTADSEIDAEVRVFENHIGLVDTFNDQNEIDLNNARLFTGSGIYEGTERAIKREFDLYHKGNPIFQKTFDGGNSSIVKIGENLIELPQHFFVTGEKVFYTYDVLNEPVGIATTTISGIGLTDKLPNELYVIKENDLNVRFAASVENALNLVPIPLEITTVGFGSNHYITSQKQNVKSLISIDNMIQSPIVSTATTTGLSTSILTTDDIISFTENVEFFFSGDFIKINDEIMKVSIVGYGGSANNIYVQRPWMGTKLSTHNQFDLVTKVVGNYNIVDNTISFADAPYGKYPEGLPTNRPDERDYTGITTHSTFSGRTFMRSGVIDTNIEPYEKNVVFDGIQDQFTGIQSAFTLTVEGSDVTGIVDSNAIITIKDIFQSPRILGGVVNIAGNYFLEEDEILEKTTIYFEDNEYIGTDILTRGLPTGGRIVSVGSTKGFGYQPLVSAGGTAIVSAGGTIESIVVTNVGSGYRSGIQTVYVGVQTSSTNTTGITTCIGLATINNGRVDSVSIINPGSGYTHSNPPQIVFDAPLSYSNIDLEYASTSIGKTTGQNAKVDIVVGQGSSVIDFEFTNVGHGYEINNILTVSVGGTTGIPREYRGRYIDAGNLIAVNRQFIQNEAVGFVTTAYPSLLSNPDYDETVCKRDVGYIVDAISKDLAFGGNYYSVQSGLAYWDSGTSYVDGESTETIAAYEYIVGISSYIINNITVPTSYQPSISSVTQIKDVSIDFDDACSPSAYSSDCCSDVFSALSNYVGIITTIIGLGTASAPVIQSPISQPTLTLPTTKYFENFEITVANTQNDEFTGWTIGDLQVIDNISGLFNGQRTAFPLFFDGVRKSIKSGPGSQIDVQPTLIVFLNDILQVPGQGYIFSGGSVIRFTEAPKVGDVCKILFYRGTGSVDVEFVDILETIKEGDLLTVHSDEKIFNQDDRSVKDITSTDSVETFIYGGPGITEDTFLQRPVNWCRQTEDLIIEGIQITKDRDFYSARINPFSNIIYDIGVGSSVAYVESAKTFFDNNKENAEEFYIDKIDIINQDETRECLAVSSVNSSGIVTSISIIDGGIGYINTPTVTIANPSSGGTIATSTATISSGKVSNISIDSGGSGYSESNPPVVLVSPPTPIGETAFKVVYEGDFGFITGIGTTVVGVSSLGLVFEFSIPEDSILKDLTIVDEEYIYSGIGTGDFFVVKQTNIGYGITSIEIDGSTLVSSQDYINNVYQVHDIITDIPYTVLSDDFIASLTRYGSYSVGLGVSTTVGVGATLIIDDRTKVVTVVEDYNNLGITSFLSRSFFGEYSYGKISNLIRPYPESYSIYRDNGLLGISTSPIIRRTNSLRTTNYIS